MLCDGVCGAPHRFRQSVFPPLLGGNTHLEDALVNIFQILPWVDEQFKVCLSQKLPLPASQHLPVSASQQLPELAAKTSCFSARAHHVFSRARVCVFVCLFVCALDRGFKRVCVSVCLCFCTGGREGEREREMETARERERATDCGAKFLAARPFSLVLSPGVT
jgi:hypothetical protein